MRNIAATIDALERKAHDRAVTQPERDALLAKAAELRGAMPPQGPPPRRPTISGTADPGGPWGVWNTTGTSSTGTFTIRVTSV